jgi:hypothetical protein
MRQKKILKVIVITVIVLALVMVTLHLGGSFLGIVKAHLSGAGI